MSTHVFHLAWLLVLHCIAFNRTFCVCFCDKRTLHTVITTSLILQCCLCCRRGSGGWWTWCLWSVLGGASIHNVPWHVEWHCKESCLQPCYSEGGKGSASCSWYWVGTHTCNMDFVTNSLGRLNPRLHNWALNPSPKSSAFISGFLSPCLLVWAEQGQGSFQWWHGGPSVTILRPWMQKVNLLIQCKSPAPIHQLAPSSQLVSHTCQWSD